MEFERMNHFRKIILKDRDEIMRSVNRIDKELSGQMGQQPIEFNERGEEETVKSLLSKLDLRQRKELSLIEEALARIQSGTYGICSQCGKTILEDRLLILPCTAVCKTCARKETPS